jgi:hypothetical protein
VSAILSNIYLHEFDLFVENLISKYHSNAKDITKRNPNYEKVTRRVQYLRDKFPLIKERNVETKEEFSKLIKLRRSLSSRIPIGIRLRYVRCASYWLAGLDAPYDLVVEIRDKIASYLSDELNLELSQDKKNHKSTEGQRTIPRILLPETQTKRIAVYINAERWTHQKK